MAEQSDEKKRSRMTRRRFVGAMGGAAAFAAAQSGRSHSAQASETYYFQDSFGNTAPADPSLIDFGFYPPVPPSQSASPSEEGGASPDLGGNYHAGAYPKYNILMIVVDQMRHPALWLPGGLGTDWTSAYSATMPAITGLARQYGFQYPHYFVAATACTPSRACLLTGLYSQQTCIFETEAGYPPLLPWNSTWSAGGSSGFPTIGNVLSQSFGDGQNGYNCTWIGKWHLSGTPITPGGSLYDPSSYGFNSLYNIPTTNLLNPYPGGHNSTKRGYPSPDGLINEGAGGDYLDSFTQTVLQTHDLPQFGYTPSTAPLKHNGTEVIPIPGYASVSDAAIAIAFTDYWLPYATSHLNGFTTGGQLANPWFCAVSFINPHDIADFPWSSGWLAPTGEFTPSSNNSVLGVGFQPAPNLSSNNGYNGTNMGSLPNEDQVQIRAFPSLFSSLPPGTGNNSGAWNYEASLSSKPGVQTYFQDFIEWYGGVIQSPGYNPTTNSYATPQAWETFLNYYFWLQSCVDFQVGQVLGTNPSSNNGTPAGLAQSIFNNNTVVVFTSDHGDYGGSHGLRSKAGALYEESINVPLIVSLPEFRNSPGSGYPITIPFACSSVDLLPFLYTLALGHELWRNNNADMIYYLNNRESIFDSILFYGNNFAYYPYPGVQHRRISGISLNNATTGANNWQLYQPFVLHTTDEFPVAVVGGTAQPSHAIAFRTVDQTERLTNAAPLYGQNSFGGGKLGVYSFWDTVDKIGGNSPIKGLTTGAQYEFYNFSPSKNTTNTTVANRQEVENEWGSALSSAYNNDFTNSPHNNNNGISIQNELYALNTNNYSTGTIPQVQAAIQSAFNNYISYLECGNNMTDSSGQQNNTYPGSGSLTCRPVYEP